VHVLLIVDILVCGMAVTSQVGDRERAAVEALPSVLAMPTPSSADPVRITAEIHRFSFGAGDVGYSVGLTVETIDTTVPAYDLVRECVVSPETGRNVMVDVPVRSDRDIAPIFFGPSQIAAIMSDDCPYLVVQLCLGEDVVGSYYCNMPDISGEREEVLIDLGRCD